MALRRSRPVADDNQLDLFVYATSSANPTDTVRHDGRETLAGISSHNGQGNGSQRDSARDVVGRGGEDEGRNVRFDHAIHAGGINGATSARPGLGAGPGEL